MHALPTEPLGRLSEMEDKTYWKVCVFLISSQCSTDETLFALEQGQVCHNSDNWRNKYMIESCNGWKNQTILLLMAKIAVWLLSRDFVTLYLYIKHKPLSIWFHFEEVQKVYLHCWGYQQTMVISTKYHNTDEVSQYLRTRGIWDHSINKCDQKPLYFDFLFFFDKQAGHTRVVTFSTVNTRAGKLAVINILEIIYLFQSEISYFRHFSWLHVKWRFNLTGLENMYM